MKRLIRRAILSAPKIVKEGEPFYDDLETREDYLDVFQPSRIDYIKARQAEYTNLSKDIKTHE